MTYTGLHESLGRPEAQRIAPRRSSFRSPSSGTLSGLASQQSGPWMPARRITSRRTSTSLLGQPELPPAVIELIKQRRADRQQTTSAPDIPRKNKEALALIDEWMREPDDLGEDWWADFESELEARRFRVPERE